MQLRLPRLVLTLLVFGPGSALAQTDSTQSQPDSGTAPKGFVVEDSAATEPLVPSVASQPAPATGSVEPAMVVGTPAIHADEPTQNRRPTWAVEGSVHYGWRMGQLLHEEDRLTRLFKIVLIDADNDTSNLRPIATGPMVQAALWYKPCDHGQFGVGFGYGRFAQHPITTYNSGLTEDFFEQMLLTARYRYTHAVSTFLRPFAEAAIGWNHTSIRRIPIVAAHLSDSLIHFQESQIAQITELNQDQDVDGVHAQIGLGTEVRFAQAWSVALSGAYAWDRLWIDQSNSSQIEGSPSNLGETLSRSPDFWGFDLGFSVAREF